MSIMKNILIIGLSLFFLSCNSPSEPNAKIIKDSAIYEINNYCYDVDLNDDVVVLAASDGGYYKFDIEYNDDSFPVLEQISNENNHNLDYENETIDRVILSDGPDGIIYMLDKYTGGSSGIWFDNAESIAMDPTFINDYCYQGKYLDFSIDETEPDLDEGIDTHIIYSLMKHTALNENSDDDEFLSYSTSIVRRQINALAIGDDLSLVVDDCNYQHNLSYDSKEIHFGGGNLAVASESDGVILFTKGDDGDLDSLFSYNLAGGQAQTVYSLDGAVIGGFSNDKGCYMALLESDSNSASNYISFADGYSVNGIDFNSDIIGLAAGNDGVQLYEWLGGSSVSPYGSIDTDGYAYDLKIKNDLIFVATRTGLEIYKIGI